MHFTWQSTYEAEEMKLHAVSHAWFIIYTADQLSAIICLPAGDHLSGPPNMSAPGQLHVFKEYNWWVQLGGSSYGDTLVLRQVKERH